MDPIKKKHYHDLMKGMTKEEIIVLRNGMIWNPEDIVYTLSDEELEQMKLQRERTKKLLKKTLATGALLGVGSGLLTAFINNTSHVPLSALPNILHMAYNRRLTQRDAVWIINALSGPAPARS